MPHRLPGLRAAIDHDAIPGAQLMLLREPVGEVECLAHQRGVALVRFGQRGDVLFRNDEDMGRGLRVDVGEGHELVIFGHDLGGQLPVGNSAE